MSVNEHIKSDIVPWALPGEDIPFNISWPSTSTYDKIEIITSDDMIITKLVNVLEYKRLTENSIEIYKVKQVEGGPSYSLPIYRTDIHQMKKSILLLICSRY